MTIEASRRIIRTASLFALLLVLSAHAQTPCTTDAECDDGNVCNGVETCSSGTCAAGVPPECCTDDGCDDDVFCNGAETCQALACVAGVPPSCDDEIACTADACSNEERACTHEAPDADSDGHEDAACVDAAGNPIGDDCNDSDPAIFPGASEVCDADDEDCDPESIGSTDLDEDGFISAACCNGSTCGRDCEDNLAGVHPIAPEVCNGIDDDCSGEIDEGATVPQYADADGDGHGDPASPVDACAGTVGYSPLGNDCDDTNAAIQPGAMICTQADPAAVLVCAGGAYEMRPCGDRRHQCFPQPNGTGACQKGRALGF